MFTQVIDESESSRTITDQSAGGIERKRDYKLEQKKIVRRKKTIQEKQALIDLCAKHLASRESDKQFRQKLHVLSKSFPNLGYRAAQKWAWDYLQSMQKRQHKTTNVEEKDQILTYVQLACQIDKDAIDRQASDIIDSQSDPGTRVIERMCMPPILQSSGSFSLESSDAISSSNLSEQK